MSLKQTQWAWRLNMKPGPKLVLLALADYANDQGECYPSLKQLQQKCGYARSTLIDHLQWLNAKKIIFVQKQYDKNGYRRQNFYRMSSCLGPDFESLSPEFEPAKVRNPDGNNINSHKYGHKDIRGPESGPRRIALEGAI